MRIFKIRLFDKWARKEGVSDELLCLAVLEIEDGLFEANGVVPKPLDLLHNPRSSWRAQRGHPGFYGLPQASPSQ